MVKKIGLSLHVAKRAYSQLFIHHLLRQLAATYKYTVKHSCTINYIYMQ